MTHIYKRTYIQIYVHICTLLYMYNNNYYMIVCCCFYFSLNLGHLYTNSKFKDNNTNK